MYSASTKQKSVMKSPTESELVALTEFLGLVELFDEFVTFMVNEKLGTPTIYQDSLSAVTLVTQGGGRTRTRHLCTRLHLAKEAVDAGRLIIKHYKADIMIADGLTKALEGAEFKTFIKSLHIFMI